MTQDPLRNPFYQPEGYWQLVFNVPRIAIAPSQMAFEDLSISISSFEADKAGKQWRIEVLSEEKLEEEEIRRRLSILAALHVFPLPEFTLTYLQQRDWVSEVKQSFPPIHIGRFYIYGSHHTEAPPSGLTAIKIDAGQAFGSGEHESTSACLQAFDDLAKEGRQFKSMLDMGCGSAILALALAKTWKQTVIAADIDEVAVKVAEENAVLNGEAERVETLVSDGYAHKTIHDNAPYDLIVANILARPLIELAPTLSAHLKKNGIAVLSGFLKRQEKQVLAVHEAQGLKFLNRYSKGGWHTLVLEK